MSDMSSEFFRQARTGSDPRFAGRFFYCRQINRYLLPHGFPGKSATINMVNDMKHSNLFSDDQITFEYSLPGLTEREINNLIPDDFNGKDFFVKFYLAHNGGVFTMEFSDMEGGAYYYIDTFYPVPDDGSTLNLMEIDRFYYISGKKCWYSPHFSSIHKVWELRKEYSPEIKEFTKSHFPFAVDAGDNDYWLDMKSGCIKYIRWECDDDPDNATLVAPTFYDFCTNLRARLREEDRIE